MKLVVALFVVALMSPAVLPAQVRGAHHPHVKRHKGKKHRKH